MMAGMDDKDDMEDEITLEAMSGLAKILAKLDENNVRQILINICLRIRPCFEKVRAHATYWYWYREISIQQTPSGPFQVSPQ